MEIRRTANAGVLLKLDGVSILMDGVCREVKPYLATPPEERARITACFPDVIAFTHAHKDHYDPAFAADYQRQTNGVVLGPAGLPGCKTVQQPLQIGAVKVTPVPSRHIGPAGKTTSHFSFIVEGTACVWFLGDASPLQWERRNDLPSPDVLIVPYAYATTSAAWEHTQRLGAKHILLLHLPPRENDPAELWKAVDQTVGDADLEILKIGKSFEI